MEAKIQESCKVYKQVIHSLIIIIKLVNLMNSNFLMFLLEIILLFGQAFSQSNFFGNTVLQPPINCQHGVKVSADLETLACFSPSTVKIYRMGSDGTYALFQIVNPETSYNFQPIHSISEDGLLINVGTKHTSNTLVNPMRITAKNKKLQYSRNSYEHYFDQSQINGASFSSNGKYFLSPGTNNYTLQEFSSKKYIEKGLITTDTNIASSFSSDSQYLLVVSQTGSGYAQVFKVEDLSIVAQKNGHAYKDGKIFQDGGFIYFSAFQDDFHFITERCPSTGGLFQLLNDYKLSAVEGGIPVEIITIDITKNLAVAATNDSVAIFYRNNGEPFSPINPIIDNIVVTEPINIVIQSIQLFSNLIQPTNTFVVLANAQKQINMYSYWNTCPFDVGSTGVQLPSGECQCLSYHSWDPSAQKCLPLCNNYLAVGKDPKDATQCLCLTEAIWDSVTRQCVINTLPCNKKCQETTTQTGIILVDGTCECKIGYQFDYSTLSCILLNCDVIPYSAGFTFDKLDCKCQQSFRWDATFKRCIVDCEKIVDPLGLGINLNNYACQCQSGSTWESSALSCVRDCTLIANSTGTNVNSVQCKCMIGFIWENALCVISCGLNVGQAETYNSSAGRCDCLANFYWSYQNNFCFRDCTTELSAIPIQGPDADSCYCLPGYSWNNHCTLTCNGEFDVSILQTDSTKCQCETNSYFIVSKNKCMVKCNEDPSSTGQFKIDRCVCKANSQWNEQTNKCQCITGYTFNDSTQYCESSSATAVTLGVVGGAIGSGSLIFIGLFMKQRSKRRKEDNEAVVEVRESVQEMAAKEEQI